MSVFSGRLSARPCRPDLFEFVVMQIHVLGRDVMVMNERYATKMFMVNCF